MALENKSIPVTFQGGQQSGTNPQTIGESSFTSLENSVSRRVGEYEKVSGNAQLSSTLLIDSISSPQYLNRAKFLTPGEGTSTTVWTSASAIPKDTYTGNWTGSPFANDVPVNNLNRTSIENRITSNALQYYNYVESADGVKAIESGYRLKPDGTYALSIRVYNLTTKVVLVDNPEFGTLASINDNTFVGVQFDYADSGVAYLAFLTSGGEVRVQKFLTTGTPFLAGATQIANIPDVTQAKLLSTNAFTTANATAILVINQNSVIKAVNLSSSGIAGSSTGGYSCDTFKDAACSSSNAHVYVVYSRGSALYSGAFTPTNLTINAVETALGIPSSVSAASAVMRVAAGTINAFRFQSSNITGDIVAQYLVYDGDFQLSLGSQWSGINGDLANGVMSDVTRLPRVVGAVAGDPSQSCTVVSSAAIVNGAPLIMVATSAGYSSVNSAYFLISYQVVSKVFGGRAVGFSSSPIVGHKYAPINHRNLVAKIGVTYIQDVRKISLGSATHAHGTSLTGSGRFTDYTTGSAVVSANFTPTTMPVIETSEEYLVGSGVLLSYPKAYAGDTPVESTLLLAPDVNAVLTDTGGTLDSGSYGFAVVLETTDKIGRIYKSAPGGPGSVTLTSASKKFSIQFMPAAFTYHKSLTPVLYLTEANGSILYRTSLTATRATGPYSTFEVSALPANLTEGEIIYTEGGVVPNVAPECVTSLVEHKGRVFAGTASPGIAYTYSKDKTPNEPYNFAFDTFISSEAVDPITALSSFDDKLIVHTSEQAYYIAGDGPSDTGAGNNLSTMIRLPYAAGVINCNAISVMSDQIIYVSKRGLVSMDRSLAVTPILAMQSVDMSSTTSMVYRPNQNELWIGTSAAGTVVYNHFTQTWSRLPTLNSLHAVVSGNLYTRLTTTSGTVYQETPAAYTLDGGNNSQRLETAWIAMTGIEGYQRVFSFNMLGQIVANPVTIYIDLYYNYDNATLVETVPYTHTGAATQIRVIPKIQKCTAIKLVIRESSTTAGFKFTGLQFEVGVKAGLYRAPR